LTIYLLLTYFDISTRKFDHQPATVQGSRQTSCCLCRRQLGTVPPPPGTLLDDMIPQLTTPMNHNNKTVT